MSQSIPLVSVVMPVYNAERFLVGAMNSVCGQTFPKFEIIAVDDGSTDRSGKLLEVYAERDPRLRVIRRANTGIVGALNDGLKVARGEFIARMDADDLCLPSRFEKQLAFLRAHPQCVGVGSAFLYFDAAGGLIKECVRPADHATIEKQLLAGNGGVIIHPAAMFRREAVERAGGYREMAQWVEDLDLYLRLARLGELNNLPDVLLHYRFHEQSVNFTRNRGRHQRMLDVLREAYAARGLVFDVGHFPDSDCRTAISVDDLRDFAITSLRFGKNGRPWHYVLRALRKEPASRETWRTFSYVLKHHLGMLPQG